MTNKASYAIESGTKQILITWSKKQRDLCILERNDKNMEENKIAQMKELVSSLSQAAKAYYQESREIISNFEYDKLYDQLDRKSVV